MSKCNESQDNETDSEQDSLLLPTPPRGHVGSSESTRIPNFDFDSHFVVKLLDEDSGVSQTPTVSKVDGQEVTKDAEHYGSSSTNVPSETAGDTGLNLLNLLTGNIPRLYSITEPRLPSFSSISSTSRKSFITDTRVIQHECVRQPWSKPPFRRRMPTEGNVEKPTKSTASVKEDTFSVCFWRPLERPLKSLKFKAGGDSISRAVTANPDLYSTKTVQTDLSTVKPPPSSPGPILEVDVRRPVVEDIPKVTSCTTDTVTRPKTTGSMIPHPYFAKPTLGNPNRYGKNLNFMALDTNASIWSPLTTKVTSSEAQRSILSTCCQRQPIPIQLMIDYLLSIKKIGEGVYGEVYKGYHKGGTDLRVFKIIPIEGSKFVNGEKQKKFQEIEPEILVAQEVNKLRKGINGCQTDGQSKLVQAKICVGSYPAVLAQQWKVWHKTYVSQNDLPSFDENQLYAMLEFDFHGSDVETYKFKNAKQSLAVLLNVVHTLAASEVGIQFEHRDLHWGNILVLKTREVASSYTIKGDCYRIPNCGLKTTLIDYTISRVTKSDNDVAVFTDLANDEDQFCGSEEYQFEIYRMMRKKNNNDWRTFCPKSNVYWIHYLAGKLIEKARYMEPTTGIHYYYKNKLLRIQASILKYDSCWDCVRNFVGAFVKDIESEG